MGNIVNTPIVQLQTPGQVQPTALNVFGQFAEGTKLQDVLKTTQQQRELAATQEERQAAEAESLQKTRSLQQEALRNQIDRNVGRERFRSVAVESRLLQPQIRKALKDAQANNEPVNLDALNNRLDRRIADLESQGLPANDTIEFKELLNRDPAAALAEVDSIVGTAKELGVFEGAGKAARVAKTQNFPDGTTVITMSDGERRVIAPDGREVLGDEAAQVINQANVFQARQKGAERGAQEAAKIIEQINRLPQRERDQFIVRNAGEVTNDLAVSRGVLRDIDRAIELLENTAFTTTGPIAAQLPSFKAETQELESIAKKLGVDRLANFKGQTSERELQTAFEAGFAMTQDKEAALARLRAQRDSVLGNQERLRGLDAEFQRLVPTASRAGTTAPTQQAPAATQQTGGFTEGQRIRNPTTGEVREFRNGQWVPVNG